MRIDVRAHYWTGGLSRSAGEKAVKLAIFVNDVPLPPGGDPIREGKVIGRLCEILYQEGP